ncbi:MAG: hypothetical protein NVSMB27_07030 [Ktedonobacteraceae bacterium]
MNTRLEQLTHRPLGVTRALYIYLWMAGLITLGLFLQGCGSLALRLMPNLASFIPTLIATPLNATIPHALLHIAWGGCGLFILLAQPSNRIRIGFGVIFGTFYTLLGIFGAVVTSGIIGIVIHNPFDLGLIPMENVVHLIAGPLLLVLALLAWRSVQQPAER